MPSVAIIGTRGYPSFYGGFETAVRKIAPFLVDKGWDVVVYGRRGSTCANGPLRDERVRTRTTWGLETKSLSTLSYGFTSSLDTVIFKPDVALVMNVANGYWLPLLKSRGIPTLVNVDGIEWDRAKWGTVAKQVFRTGAILTSKFANMLVYDSIEIKRRWSSEFGRDGVFIPYGGASSASLPVEPGLAHRGYILLVARFVPENSTRLFFDAADELARKWDVVLVGSSGYGGELDEAARVLSASNPHVHWYGQIGDDARLFSLWQHAGAYFHGHTVGGTNPALVQAMACGAPIVALDTVYNREVLSSAGVFVNASRSAVAEAISTVMGDTRLQAELSTKATERAAENYTWRAVCEDYERALTQLVLA
jgi:glycosyltransferase involved in cell wall biosynthesis